MDDNNRIIFIENSKMKTGMKVGGSFQVKSGVVKGMQNNFEQANIDANVSIYSIQSMAQIETQKMKESELVKKQRI